MTVDENLLEIKTMFLNVIFEQINDYDI